MPRRRRQSSRRKTRSRRSADRRQLDRSRFRAPPTLQTHLAELQGNLASLLQRINLLTQEINVLHINSQSLYARILSDSLQDSRQSARDLEEISAIRDRMNDLSGRLMETTHRMHEDWAVVKILDTNGAEFTREQESP